MARQIINSKSGSQIAGALLAVASGITSASTLPDFVRNGEVGFVVSHIRYALAEGVEEAGACPDGVNQSYRDPRDAYVNLPPVPDAENKTYEELERAARSLTRRDPEIKSFCLHPELGSPDPDYRVLTSDDVRIPGIDLDGDDGVDNKYARVVGCNKGYQPRGQANLFNIGMLSGSWGMLIQLSDVDDLRNDDHVNVRIFANGDPIRLSPAREPLKFATYTVHSEPRFHSHTRGHIKDGVLYTEPVEVRIPYDTNAMYSDRVLRDARLQMTIGQEGVIEGYLAGYAPVEEQYDLEFGLRQARVDTSESSELGPRSRRLLSGIGRAGALGYTCEGAYYAMYEYADGHPDPVTGESTSISTQYDITAIPAFVVEKDTRE